MKVTYRKATRKRPKKPEHAARYLIRCNCSYDGKRLCGEKLEIFVPVSPDDNFFEINGVLDTRERWIELFKQINLMQS
jgi:hypothetical protein